MWPLPGDHKSSGPPVVGRCDGFILCGIESCCPGRSIIASEWERMQLTPQLALASEEGNAHDFFLDLVRLEKSFILSISVRDTLSACQELLLSSIV